MQEQINHIEKTVDIIARAVAEGFGQVDGELKEIRETMATKTNIKELRQEMIGKDAGINRRIGDELERHMKLEDRVTKVEIEVGFIK